MSEANIFLLGFMSSGKSKIGRKLAQKLGREFVDLDEHIEKQTAKSIQQIFDEEGEQKFRELESKALQSIEKNCGLVLALGGGTPCSEENMSFIKENGLSVYLKVSPEVLIGRLRQNIGNRPLLKDLSTEQLAEFVKASLAAREPFYSLADYILEDNNPKVNSITEILGIS